MRAIVFAVLAGACWGIGEVCTRSVLHDGRVGPMTAVVVRSLVALPILFAAFWLVRRLAPGTEPATWTGAGSTVLAKLLLGSGVAAGGLALVFFYAALRGADVSIVKPIAFGVAPTLAVLLGWLLLGESMTPRKAIAVALIVGGIVLLGTDGHRSIRAASGTAAEQP